MTELLQALATALRPAQLPPLGLTTDAPCALLAAALTHAVLRSCAPPCPCCIPPSRPSSPFPQAAHPSPAQRMRMMGAKGSSSARPRRASPLATHNESAESGGGGRSGNEGWTHVSSMGDLEALDAILDTLVRGCHVGARPL